MPFAEFLLSPANQGGLQGLISPGEGKIRTVQLLYWQRLLESGLLSNQANPNCTTGDTPENNQATYTLDTSINLQTRGVTLTYADLEAICDPNSEILATLLEREMNVLRRGAATRVTEQGAALSGTWGGAGDLFTTGDDVGEVNGQNELVVATLNSDGTINKHAWIKVRNAADDLGFCPTVVLMGGKTMREFFQASQAGCCANEGLDVGRLFDLYGYAYAYDRRLETALGDVDRNLLVQPGALQVLQHVRSPWLNGFPGDAIAGANYVHKAIMDPQTGFVYDISWTDDCGVISFNLTWTGKVVGMPQDMFDPSDVLAGTTYVTKVLVTNP
jgi:hypothetical protein